jgi:hypothetical protein
MTKQPEALQFADELEKYEIFLPDLDAVAAELRRLHEVNQELLEALKFVMSAHGEQLDLAFEQANAAIAKGV